MENQPFKPYVPEESNLVELTLKAMVLGVFMALLLGAAGQGVAWVNCGRKQVTSVDGEKS